MLPAVTLLVDSAGGGVVRWQVIGVGSILIFLLVLLRMGRILHTVEVQAVQLAALARSDALTGAPNRRTWDHELSRACATRREQGSPLCVAMIDMDHFKAYNDTNGHQAGDRLLCEAVSAWGERLGPEELLARYGGEEFAVLLPGVAPADAQGGSRACSRSHPTGRRSRRVSASGTRRVTPGPPWRAPISRSTRPRAAGATASSPSEALGPRQPDSCLRSG